MVWVPANRRPRSDASLSIRRDLIGRIPRRRGLPARIRAEDAVVDVAEDLRVEEAVALVCDAASTADQRRLDAWSR